MAARGLRVRGIAKVTAIARALPQSQQDLRLEFLGLVGLADPLRASVPAAIAECRRAGTRVVVVTRGGPPKPVLHVVLFVVAGILTLAVQVPVAQDIFRFGPLHLPDLALTGAAGRGVLVCWN